MTNIIPAIVMGLIAFASYNQSKKSKAANENSKANIWMLVSLGSGVIAVISILGVLF
jgi:multisubunit Na+/H+ antiporter MnhB subunit